MKKIFVILCMLFCSSAVFAIDFGGTVAVSTGISTNNLTSYDISPMGIFTMWTRQPLGNIGSFAAEGNLRYAGGVTVVDATLLKANVNFGPVKVEAGRFGVADATGTIYNMTADGAFVTFTSRFVNLYGYGAWTGLLNSNNVAFNGLEGTYEASNPVYDLTATPKFAVGLARIALPNLIKGQTFTLDALGLYQPFKAEANRVYGTASVNGPIVRMVYYGLMGSGSYIASSPAGDEAKLGYMAKGNIVWYPEVLSSSLSASITYADKNFCTVSAGGPSQDGSLSWSNVLDAQIGISAKPVSIVLMSFTGDLVCAENLDDGNFSLHSFQWKLTNTAQIVSDLSLSFSVGEIVPLNKGASSYLNGSFGATLAF